MHDFKDKNILVTGGTGFVGSHLVEELIKRKANIVTTFITTNPFSYFFKKKLHKKVTMSHIDVNDFEMIFDLITQNNIEYVFHLAAQALVEPAYYNPRQTLNTNILGTVNILECARLFPKVRAVIVASSDKAYGKLGKNKYVESDSLKGDHPYEVSKSAADLISTSYYKTYKTPVVVTRFGNIYGEGDQNYSRIVPGLIHSIIKNEILEIRSDGTYVRDYLYVKDVISGYLVLAENIQNIKGEAFNFGSNDTLSVLDLVKISQKVLKKKIRYTIKDTAKNEIPFQSLDYSKIRKKLGWKPQFTVKSKIKKTFDWYKSIL